MIGLYVELKDNDRKYKPGKGSQKQTTVLVMTESKTVEPTGKYRHKPTKKVSYIKMQLLDDLCKETTNEQIEKFLDLESSVVRDGANNYNDLQDKLTDHKAVVIEPKKDTLKILPWVHIAISNAKRLYWTCTTPLAMTILKITSMYFVANSTGDTSIQYLIG